MGGSLRPIFFPAQRGVIGDCSAQKQKKANLVKESVAFPVDPRSWTYHCQCRQ